MAPNRLYLQISKRLPKTPMSAATKSDVRKRPSYFVFFSTGSKSVRVKRVWILVNMRETISESR
ncbi:hypothetical protein RHGRI_033179 [Rhododendron griersonianum]|uniref:Uncharacterized protein n=1 Tax=Rhododendron griersonianum TaxID=479676 RepID=A0AAV6HZF9_9ERIC|nr:hypothetical protein RHGRI_033179 [Rhododendron griersonianum]